jgi:hypothetical protein
MPELRRLISRNEISFETAIFILVTVILKQKPVPG